MSHAVSLRPRRKLLTPVTGGLAVLIVAAAGFIGGVQVQKHQATTTTGAPTGGFQPGGGQQQAATDATTGTVSSVDGDLLYVKDASGNTVKVKVKSSADVTRTASTDADKVHPGDTVTITGAANSKGTVTATAVVASDGKAR